MIRFIIEYREVDTDLGIDVKRFVTTDSVLQLEELLKRGGVGDGKFLQYSLIGCEIIYD